MALKYPVPPLTNGRHPDTWPTAKELTDIQLLHWLYKTEEVDAKQRMHPENYTEANREACNKVHHDLFIEAVSRGLRQPIQSL